MKRIQIIACAGFLMLLAVHCTSEVETQQIKSKRFKIIAPTTYTDFQSDSFKIYTLPNVHPNFQLAFFPAFKNLFFYKNKDNQKTLCFDVRKNKPIKLSQMAEKHLKSDPTGMLRNINPIDSTFWWGDYNKSFKSKLFAEKTDSFDLKSFYKMTLFENGKEWIHSNNGLFIYQKGELVKIKTLAGENFHTILAFGKDTLLVNYSFLFDIKNQQKTGDFHPIPSEQCLNQSMVTVSNLIGIEFPSKKITHFTHSLNSFGFWEKLEIPLNLPYRGLISTSSNSIYFKKNNEICKINRANNTEESRPSPEFIAKNNYHPFSNDSLLIDYDWQTQFFKIYNWNTNQEKWFELPFPKLPNIINDESNLYFIREGKLYLYSLNWLFENAVPKSKFDTIIKEWQKDFHNSYKYSINKVDLELLKKKYASYSNAFIKEGLFQLEELFYSTHPEDIMHELKENKVPTAFYDKACFTVAHDYFQKINPSQCLFYLKKIKEQGNTERYIKSVGILAGKLDSLKAQHLSTDEWSYQYGLYLLDHTSHFLFYCNNKYLDNTLAFEQFQETVKKFPNSIWAEDAQYALLDMWLSGHYGPCGEEDFFETDFHHVDSIFQNYPYSERHQEAIRVGVEIAKGLNRHYEATWKDKVRYGKKELAYLNQLTGKNQIKILEETHGQSFDKLKKQPYMLWDIDCHLDSIIFEQNAPKNLQVSIKNISQEKQKFEFEQLCAFSLLFASDSACKYRQTYVAPDFSPCSERNEVNKWIAPNETITFPLNLNGIFCYQNKSYKYDIEKLGNYQVSGTLCPKDYENGFSFSFQFSVREKK